MDRSGFLDKVGVDNVFENVNDALKKARDVVGTPQPAALESQVQEVAWEKSAQKQQQKK